MRKFLTEVKKFFLIRDTESLFVQYGDNIVCAYMAHEEFKRCHYDKNGILVVEHYICKSKFKSLYRKFLDNEIETCNYEDIMDGCNKFYLKSEKEYAKFLRVLFDRKFFRSDEMYENKFSYKEVFVRYDNVQIGVICSKMVEKVFEYNAHDDEDVSVNYVYYVKKEKFYQLLEKFFDGSILCKHEKESQEFFPTSQEQLEKVFLILDK